MDRRGAVYTIKFSHKGNFKTTENFLDRVSKINFEAILNKYGQEGVNELSKSTPINTGKTSSSWYYEISISKGTYKITWLNSNVIDGVPVAILLQYGHATRNGGYVEGYDYINPALRPIFDRIADEVWREVNKL